MFFVLSKLVDVLLEPLWWTAALVLVGLRRPVTRATRLAPVVGVIVLLAFSTEPVSNALVRSLEATPVRLAPGTTYDAIVLLGGPLEARASEDSGTRAYNGNAERVIVTYELLREGHARDVIVSGGRPDPEDRVSESRVLRDQLVAFGVDAARVVTEERSRNTRENAEETKRVVEARGYRSLLLVTSAFHVARARAAFEAVGLPVDVYPCDFRSFDASKHRMHLLPRAAHLDDSTWALREHVGRLVYRMVGFARAGRAPGNS